jgi:hypothetical protein
VVNAHQLLLEQTRHHYRWLEWVTADVDPDQAAWRPGAAASCTATLEELASTPLVELHPGFETMLATREAWWRGYVFHLADHLGQVGSLHAALDLGWPSPDSEYPQDPPTGS